MKTLSGANSAETGASAPNPTVRALIRDAGDALSPAERKVARALLAAYPVAGLETVSRLSARARVSGPTVIRFADRLGFSGYPAMQEALRHEVQERMSSPLSQYPQVKPSEDGELLGLSRRTFLSAIEASLADFSEREFDVVVDLMSDKRRPLLAVGGRFSQMLASYLIEHLNMLRPGARFVGSGPFPVWDELIDIGKKHVFVAFDYRRYQNDTIEVARRAAERGATVVLFTDPYLSPIVDVADHVVPSRVEALPPFDSMVPAMALIEAIVAGVSAKVGDVAKARIEELEHLRLGSTWDEHVPDDGERE